MTKIILHGILRNDFGESIELKLNTIHSLIDAVDANRQGFLKKLNKLSEMGLNYCLVVDGKVVKESSQIKGRTPKQIDFVPIVCGQGIAIAAIGAGLIIAGSSAFLGITALSVIGGIFLSTGLSMLLAPKPDYPDAVAAERTVTGLEKSFAFANRANVAAQGISVPIGYGRLRVGSTVIQATVKTYPQNTGPIDAMRQNPYFIDKTVAESESEIAS